MRAALIAVASPPPKRFAGGGYWEAMKGDMTGWFELRVDGPGRHHCRLFCLLDYEAKNLDKPIPVVIDGRDKPFRTTLSDAEYAAVRRLGDEYRRRNPRSLARDQAGTLDLGVRNVSRWRASFFGSAVRPSRSGSVI